MGERERDRDRARPSTDAALASLWIDFVLLPDKLEDHLAGLASGSLDGPLPADLITMFLDQVLVNHKAALASASGSSVSKDGEKPKGLWGGRATRSRPFALQDIPLPPRLLRHHPGSYLPVLCFFFAQGVEGRTLNPLLGTHPGHAHLSGRSMGRIEVMLNEDGQTAVNGTSKTVVKTMALLCERSARVAVAANLSLSDIESLISSQQHQYLLLRALMEHDQSRLPVHECNLHRWRIHNSLHAANLQSFDDLADMFKAPRPGVVDLVSTRATGDSITEEESFSVRFLERVFCEDENHCDIQPLKEDSVDEPPNVENGGPVKKSQFFSIDYQCKALFDVAESHFMRGRIARAHEIFTKCGQLFASSSDVQIGFSKQRQVGAQEDRLVGFIIACRMLLAKATSPNGDKDSTINITASPLPELGAPTPSQLAVIACEQSRWLARESGRGLSTEKQGLHNPLSVTEPSKELGFRTKRSADERESETSVPKRRKLELLLLDQMSQTQGPGDMEDVTGTPPSAVDGQVSEDFLEVSCPVLGCSQESQGDHPVPCPAAEGTEVAHIVDPRDATSQRVGQNILQPETKDAFSAAKSLQSVAWKEIVQTFVEDLPNGFLSWGYVLSVEKDPNLPASVQCQLAGCNIVRSVLEGAPVESFLRVSNRFEHSEVGMEFFLKLVFSARRLEVKPSKRTVRCVRRGASKGGRLAQQFLTHGVDEMSQGVLEGNLLAQRMDELAIYACCIIDQPWCWALATSIGFTLPDGLAGLCGDSTSVENWEHSAAIGPQGAKMHDAGGLSSQERLRFGTSDLDPDIFKGRVMFALVQADSLLEVEAIVSDAKMFLSTQAVDNKGRLNAENEVFSKQCMTCSCQFQEGSETELCAMCRDSADGNQETLTASMAGILRQRAFDALENMKEVGIAKRLYQLAKVCDPGDFDSDVMLWLVEKLMPSKSVGTDNRCEGLPKSFKTCFLSSSHLVEYVILSLIDKEFWVYLREFCQWCTILHKEISHPERGPQKFQGEGQESKVRTVSLEGDPSMVFAHADMLASYRKQLQTMRVATALGDLMPLCEAAASRNQSNEEASRFGSTLWQRFEDFLCLLVGVEVSSSIQGGEDSMLKPVYPGAKGVPLLSRVQNPAVLTRLASLTAGWLRRCNAAGLTPWAPAVDRYGVLAAVTGGASLPPPIGSLPHAAAIYRPVLPKVSPEFGRDLFRVLLEGIVALPGEPEGGKERGHCWLQGLADLAYEDEFYVKALQLYLQAGAIRSAHYCDSSSCMPDNIFTQEVIRRMINACRAIGAGLQAAILCQCLTPPDYESAFRFLQDNFPILDKDAAAYFQCIWEVPLLELLVHMYEKAGDEARVNTLIGYLQHPAMNVHNPQAIRKAHITSMEQRFLQQLSQELLG